MLQATRDPFFDNAKFLAILLVVGHLIEPLRDVGVARGLYMTVDAFHMPVFVLISGYVLGLMLPARYFQLVRTTAVRVAAVPALLGAFACAYLVVPESARQWLYYAASYHDLGAGVVSGLLHRGVVLAVGFVLLTAFLALVPTVTTRFTALGAATLYVYLLHRYPRKGASSLGLYDVPWLHALGGLAFVAAVAVGLTLLLSSRPVLTVFRPVVEPKLDWLFRLRRDRDNDADRDRQPMSTQ